MFIADRGDYVAADWEEAPKTGTTPPLALATFTTHGGAPAHAWPGCCANWPPVTTAPAGDADGFFKQNSLARNTPKTSQVH